MEDIIQVTGRPAYTEYEWGDALTHFVSSAQSVQRDDPPPSIFFASGNFTLRLDPERREYVAHGDPKKRVPFPFIKEARVRSGSGQDEMDAAVNRFIKEGHLLTLILSFRSGGEVHLWKTNRGRRLGMLATEIPSKI